MAYNIIAIIIACSELSGRLALCCEVMTNVCITESEAVKADETFTSIAVLSLQISKPPPPPNPQNPALHSSKLGFAMTLFSMQ